jgi:hypothetical protein
MRLGRLGVQQQVEEAHEQHLAAEQAGRQAAAARPRVRRHCRPARALRAVCGSARAGAAAARVTALRRWGRVRSGGVPRRS